ILFFHHENMRKGVFRMILRRNFFFKWVEIRVFYFLKFTIQIKDLFSLKCFFNNIRPIFIMAMAPCPGLLFTFFSSAHPTVVMNKRSAIEANYFFALRA